MFLFCFCPVWFSEYTPRLACMYPWLRRVWAGAVGGAWRWAGFLWTNSSSKSSALPALTHTSSSHHLCVQSVPATLLTEPTHNFSLSVPRLLLWKNNNKVLGHPRWGWDQPVFVDRSPGFGRMRLVFLFGAFLGAAMFPRGRLRDPL